MSSTYYVYLKFDTRIVYEEETMQIDSIEQNGIKIVFCKSSSTITQKSRYMVITPSTRVNLCRTLSMNQIKEIIFFLCRQKKKR